MHVRDFSPLPLVLLIGFFVSCGSDNNDRPPQDVIQGNPGNNGSNNGSNNGASTGTSGTNNGTTGTNNGGGGLCGDATCDPDRKCVKDVCVRNELKVACEDPYDLGILDGVEGALADGTTEGFSDSLTTSCATGAEISGADAVVKFELSQDAVVELSLTSPAPLDWVIELRTDNCESADSAILCSAPDSFQFQGKAGTTYFAVVEPGRGIDKGDFQVDVSFLPAGTCAPIGARSCDAGTITQCYSDGDRTFDCGAECDGDVCAGDGCGQAVVVTAPMSFSGTSGAYSNNFNFANQPTCSTNSTSGFDTPGEDLVLSLPGLTAGQTVTVDASMDGTDSAILVQSTCGDTEACVAANDLGDRLTWTVEAAGDYFVVIDRRDLGPETFSFDVDIQ